MLEKRHAKTTYTSKLVIDAVDRLECLRRDAKLECDSLKVEVLNVCGFPLETQVA